MLRGEMAGLRARQVSDVPILHAELYDDVATRMRADSRPWWPIPQGSPSSPFALTEASDDAAVFSVVRLAGEELAGEALLWGIDQHNRLAHIGISLRPAFRGHGLGADIVRLLCYYGFAVRGMHRLQVETLTDNAAMIAIATAAGFTREGTLRGVAWVDGDFADEAVFGLLAAEWRDRYRGELSG
jgi:RimJ/RimL family protein N-acetyltransferase